MSKVKNILDKLRPDNTNNKQAKTVERIAAIGHTTDAVGWRPVPYTTPDRFNQFLTNLESDIDSFIAKANPDRYNPCFYERTVDGDRDYGQLQFVGQLESPLLEGAHVPGVGARPFGEHHQRSAFLQYLSRVFVGFMYLFRSGFVHEDVARAFAGFSHEENLPQRLLHHPLEVAAQEAVDEEDVERSLVVGHEDVGGLLVHVLVSAYDHGDEQHAAEDDGPDFSGIVSPEMGAAEP